jgi:beta-lactamase class D
MLQPALFAAVRVAMLSLVVLGGCAADSNVVAPESPVSEQPRPRGLTVEHRPALGEPLTAAGYVGVFVLLDPATETLTVSDRELAERGFIPASTFKIPSSLIALETGVADSTAFALPWDGVERWAPDWNRDHDMRSAFRVSAVWYYQELARRIGAERMAEWLRAADYGNADSSGAVDMFWLAGNLRISPREQVEFLRRLHEGGSPFRPEVVTTFLDEVMIYERRDGVTIRSKTGWSMSQDLADPTTAGFEGNLGWYVGSVEQADGSRIYFATLLLAPEPPPEHFRDDRRELTNTLLRKLGYLE